MSDGWTAVYVAADDGTVVAYIEEMPGAHAQGQTIEEAEVNLREALEMVAVPTLPRGTVFGADHDDTYEFWNSRAKLEALPRV